MGKSNIILFPFYLKCWDLIRLKINLKKEDKIACIGDQGPTATPITKLIYSKGINMHFFDILCKDKDFGNYKTFHFDINNKWEQITNYNVVTMIRTSMYITDKDNFFSNLKKCINNNKYVIMDFHLNMRKMWQKYTFDLREMFSKKELDELNTNLYNYNLTNDLEVITYSDFKNNGIELEVIGKLYNNIKNDFIVLTYLK